MGVAGMGRLRAVEPPPTHPKPSYDSLEGSADQRFRLLRNYFRLVIILRLSIGVPDGRKILMKDTKTL